MKNGEVSSGKHSLAVKSSTGVPANLITAKDEWSFLDGSSGCVTLLTLPKPTSVATIAQKIELACQLRWDNFCWRFVRLCLQACMHQICDVKIVPVSLAN